MSLDTLTTQLGYCFKDLSLLERALTHSSLSQEHNERLEFLGDALVNLIVGEKLFKQFPDATEGQLTRIRASLVKGEHLAQLAERLSLGQYLQLGPSDTTHHFSKSRLADTLEAVVGAIYIDSDIETCTACVLDWLRDDLSKLSLSDRVAQDAKTHLQELCQSRNWPLPQYEVAEKTGPAHAPLFIVRCDAGNHSATGSEYSRRGAEQLAAQAILALLEANDGQA